MLTFEGITLTTILTSRCPLHCKKARLVQLRDQNMQPKHMGFSFPPTTSKLGGTDNSHDRILTTLSKFGVPVFGGKVQLGFAGLSSRTTYLGLFSSERFIYIQYIEFKFNLTTQT